MNKMPDEMNPQKQDASGAHNWTFAALTTGLILALVGVGVLWVRANQMNQRLTAQIANLEDNTQTQVAKLSEATATLLDQRLETVNEEFDAAIKGAQARMAGMNAALNKAKSLSEQETEELRSNLQQQQQQVTGELASLKDATASASSKIQEVSTDVSGVKTSVASTQQGLDKTTADLKRVIGDMGAMSGLIATNAKELEALRALGERNYVEFDLSKRQPEQKVGDVVVTLRNSDAKRNRYTVDILADDRRVQKKDKTVNEPVQFYMSKSRQPYEFVVNQVKKDEIVGYLSTPKAMIAQK
jgi:chromosome segregation ATPase